MECADGLSAAEKRMLQVAMERSKLDRARVRDADVPEAPCFTPTLEEWKDPMRYIRSISDAGYKYGIVRIVPPHGWDPPCGLSDELVKRRFTTRKQAVHSLQQGLPFPDGKDYTLLEYKAMANKFKQEHFPHLVATGASSAETLGSTDASKPATRTPPFATRPLPVSPVQRMSGKVEREYWDIVETGKTELCVEYGND